MHGQCSLVEITFPPTATCRFSPDKFADSFLDLYIHSLLRQNYSSHLQTTALCILQPDTHTQGSLRVCDSILVIIVCGLGDLIFFILLLPVLSTFLLVFESVHAILFYFCSIKSIKFYVQMFKYKDKIELNYSR